MIVEIPDPNCEVVKQSVFYKKICIARKEFDKIKLSKNRVVPGTYILTGVGFYDRIHGQKGVAKNGVELHPVLSISSK